MKPSLPQSELASARESVPYRSTAAIAFAAPMDHPHSARAASPVMRNGLIVNEGALSSRVSLLPAPYVNLLRTGDLVPCT